LGFLILRRNKLHLLHQKSNKPLATASDLPHDLRRLSRRAFKRGARMEADALIISNILKVKGRNVTTARPDDSVQEIANRLAQRKIGAIVIVGDNGVVDGIISERDLIRVIAQHGAQALQMKVTDVMTHNVVTCSLSTPVDETMEQMTRGRFRHLPVIEDGALIGIVSIGDIVKHHIAEVELEVSAMRGYLASG
jgi:signal-transduction protein with cAMP-binding, CBS, and nucleotidyltransferase domain